jgi:hypothetical protein
MATVKLFTGEVQEGQLPPVCMRCGAPATVFKWKRFSWGPEWVMILLVVGLLVLTPLFVIALILIPFVLRTMPVHVPLCARHRNHWLPLQVILYGGLSLLALGTTTAIILWLTARPGDDFLTELGGWLCVGTGVIFVFLLFPAAVLHMRTIRAVEITDHSITLIKVAKKFVRAVEEGPELASDEAPPKAVRRETRSERIRKPRRKEGEED